MNKMITAEEALRPFVEPLREVIRLRMESMQPGEEQLLRTPFGPVLLCKPVDGLLIRIKVEQPNGKTEHVPAPISGKILVVQIKAVNGDRVATFLRWPKGHIEIPTGGRVDIEAAG